MKTYDPRVEVRLIKSGNRTEIIPGLPVVSERYAGQVGYNLTPLLGDSGEIRVTKSVRDMAGAFSVTLADRAHSGLIESLYGLIEPMDLVEIRMAHSPSDYDGTLPIVMRGFVSQVIRNEPIVNGIPSRTVTIAGQDFGKILGIIMLYYLNNSTLNEFYVTTYSMFHKYFTDSQPKNFSADEFLNMTLDSIVNPYMAELTRLADGRSLGAQVINRMTLKNSVIGVVNANVINTSSDTSLHALIVSIIDVGAFNELYVEDDETGINLVSRPNPFRVPGSRDFIMPGAWADEINIDHVDVVALNTSRSDAGVANYFWVSSNRWAFTDNQTMREMAMLGSAETMVRRDYFNSAEKFYGYRKIEVDSNLLPPGYVQSESVTESDQQQNIPSVTSWLNERRRVLMEFNSDNVVLESGTMRLRGNERIKAGMYVNLMRGSITAPYYAFRVDHSFKPFSEFVTIVTFDRGEGFVARASQSNPYNSEISMRGA